MITGDLFLENQVGEQGDKHRIAAKKHRRHRGRDSADRGLVKTHAHHHAQKSEKGQISEVPAGDGKIGISGFFLFYRLQCKGDENQSPDKKTAEGKLHRVKIPRYGFHHHFHQAEKNGGDGDT